MKTVKLFIAACALTVIGAEVHAASDMSAINNSNDSGMALFGNPSRRPGPPPNRPPPGNGYYNWQYAGQVSAPIHSSPAVHGINYCNTEYPQQCYYYGQLCYVNNGYWWDNRNQCNWFNYYRCQ